MPAWYFLDVQMQDKPCFFRCLDMKTPSCIWVNMVCDSSLVVADQFSKYLNFKNDYIGIDGTFLMPVAGLCTEAFSF
jgi:hypothetical protein